MEGSSSNFVELKWDELADRLSDLAKARGEVKLWSKGDAPDLCIVINSHSDNEQDNTQQLRLKNDSYNQSAVNKEYFLQFSLDSVEYFAKGNIVEILSDGEFWIEMNPHVFRVEKRQNERLSVFPKFQSYVYFNVDKQADNIVFLDKHLERNHQIFNRFKKLTEKEFLEVQDSMEGVTSGEVLGFRVLDLSSNGVAFLANNKEALYFNGNNSFELTLSFEDKKFSISNAQVVYNVDYINPRARGVKMHKVGLTFPSNAELSKIIDHELSKGDHEYQVLKDFENFSN